MVRDDFGDFLGRQIESAMRMNREDALLGLMGEGTFVNELFLGLFISTLKITNLKIIKLIRILLALIMIGLNFINPF